MIVLAHVTDQEGEEAIDWDLVVEAAEKIKPGIKALLK